MLEVDLAFLGFSLEIFPGLLLARLANFSGLEKAASSILFLVLVGLFDPGEVLIKFSEFRLDDDA